MPLLPVLASVAAGVLIGLIAALGGHPTEGAIACGALVLLGIGVQVDAGAAEPRASALTAGVLMLAIVAGLAWEIYNGRDGSPFTGLVLLGAVTYLAAALASRRCG